MTEHLIKPKIVSYRNPSGVQKWKCYTICQSSFGNDFERVGTGYTPADAYQKWRRANSGLLTLEWKKLRLEDL